VQKISLWKNRESVQPARWSKIREEEYDALRRQTRIPHEIKQIEEEDTEIKLKRSKLAQSKKTMVENWVQIEEAGSESQNGIWCKPQKFRTPKLTGRLLHLFSMYVTYHLEFHNFLFTPTRHAIS
jgi:hypothetical protein